ncbi:MAG: hypothetical protein OEW75_07425, partial [Cyclobacteriaceae bacterium]|nr:hypothetical protein [Cyclobacteriaceae bacterium]
VIKFSRDGEIYHTIKFGEKYTYMKLIKEGYLSLYTARYDNSSDFSISIFKKMDGEVIEIPNIGFKKYLSEFLSECSDVQSGILNGTYKRKDLDIIQEEFNNCIEEKTQLINNTESKTDSEPDLSNPKLDELISKITSAINNSDIENKSDVLEIIDAINKRKQSGESIPNYLSNSLVNELEGHEKLTELADELINF